MKKQLMSLVAVCVVLMALLAIVLFTLLNPFDLKEIESIEEFEGSGTAASSSREEVNLEAHLSEVDTENDNVVITWDDDYWYFTSNSLPDHETGAFPNSSNPNTISEIDAEYRVSRDPRMEKNFTEVKIPGITLGGVSFDPGTAEKDEVTGWSIEAIQDFLDLGLDFNNAHVQPSGKYHYHGVPESLVEGDSPGEHSSLVGFAADGFPVYARYGFDQDGAVIEHEASWQLKTGEREDGPTGEYDGTYTLDYEYIENAGSLDECNGVYTVTPEYPDGTYVYFLTDTFPFIPRCVYGEPDDSFTQQNDGPLETARGSDDLPPPGAPPRP
jgi:hypothetical protein